MTPAPSPRPTAARPSGPRTASTPPDDADSRPETPAPSPDAVHTALRALATGAPSSPPPRYRETVAEAEAATASAVDAAAFLRAGRLPELARAVADAESEAAAGSGRGAPPDGDAAATAERGRRALSTHRRLDSAIGRAFGPEGEDGNEDADENGKETAPDGESVGVRGPRGDDGDHFRSGRDIVLPRTDQSADR
ncbi:hypothetical protein [Halogeometricum luteum]|uniref:Uncharacterized protein n=1 Tax=Halogeometricum luteum TaxID=2950537 RepID=A0ABU2FYZ5_9EURY|nr:hypothetical protein [Halogeometricum sp. S3BR5-2]MDS0293451.1 hypothetical protein [Halogeometricum sp. S3BR5-2]